MPVETILNTIRHAKTVYSMEKRYAGSTDVSLSEQGIQETCEMAERLKGQSFDVVITSTKKRSIDTAKLLLTENGHFIKNELCHERNFGIMEGHTWGEIHELDPPVLFIEVGGDQHSVNPAGGEPFEDVWLRAMKFHDYVFSHHKGSNILIVSHSIFLQMFHGLLRGMSCFESLAVPYPSTLDLTRFHFIDERLISEQVIVFKSNGEENF